MNRKFSVFLCMSFFLNAVEPLTLKQQKKALDDADVAVCGSSFSAFRKNLEKAYRVSIKSNQNDQYSTNVEMNTQYSISDQGVRYLQNYFDSADLKCKYFASEEFAIYQQRRRYGAIVTGALGLGALVKGFQLYSNIGDLRLPMIGAIGGGGLFGFWFNKKFGAWYDLSKKRQANAIYEISTKMMCLIQQRPEIKGDASSQAKNLNITSFQLSQQVDQKMSELISNAVTIGFQNAKKNPILEMNIELDELLKSTDITLEEVNAITEARKIQKRKSMKMPNEN